MNAYIYSDSPFQPPDGNFLFAVLEGWFQHVTGAGASIDGWF